MITPDSVTPKSHVFDDCEWVAVAVHDCGGHAVVVALVAKSSVGPEPRRGCAARTRPPETAPAVSAGTKTAKYVHAPAAKVARVVQAYASKGAAA